MDKEKNESILKSIKGRLVVSCQALENEPLHSSFIMGKMAYAAFQGGACGIRANGVGDIAEIKKNVELPIIAIIKRNYGKNPVFITPTMEEIDELVEEGAEIIALDATERVRPDGKTLAETVGKIREKYPHQLLMGDISTPEEAMEAERLGIDMVGTTLVGYTEYTRGRDPLEELKKVLKSVKIPVIAEGNIDTPEKARKALEMGAFSVVVGGAITRPQQITKNFVTEMEKSR
ncbi:MAG: N-acetylmannosamine-6-phosphate 2-epimerase [Fusobacteriaceae bacterium]